MKKVVFTFRDGSTSSFSPISTPIISGDRIMFDFDYESDEGKTLVPVTIFTDDVRAIQIAQREEVKDETE